MLLLLALLAAASATASSSSSASTCAAAGWTVHAGFDATCGRSKAKETTGVKTCSDCLKAAVKAKHSVYSWNENSHHCFTTDCSPKFGGAPNAHVQSGCRIGLAGCASAPAPPGPPTPAPGPAPGPATFATIPGGSFTMGRACPDCPAGAVMDDPQLKLTDGFLR